MQCVCAGRSLPALFPSKYLYWHFQMSRLRLLCFVCSSCSSFSAPTLNLRWEEAVMAERQPLWTIKKHHRCTLKTTSTFKISHIPTPSGGKCYLFLGTMCSPCVPNPVLLWHKRLRWNRRSGHSWFTDRKGRFLLKQHCYLNNFLQHSQVTGFILNAQHQNENWKTHHRGWKWL